MSLAKNLIRMIESIYEGYGKDNKYRNMVEGPKNSKGNLITRREVENSKDKTEFFGRNGKDDEFSELREYLTDVAEKALKVSNQGGDNKYGYALKLVQSTSDDILRSIDNRIKKIVEENGSLPPLDDMDNKMLKRILKG